MSDRFKKLARLHAKSAQQADAGIPMNLMQFADHLEIIMGDAGHGHGTLDDQLKSYISNLRAAQNLYGDLSPNTQARAKNSHIIKIAQTADLACPPGQATSPRTGLCVSLIEARSEQHRMDLEEANVLGRPTSAQPQMAGVIQDAEALLQKLKTLV